MSGGTRARGKRTTDRGWTAGIEDLRNDRRLQEYVDWLAAPAGTPPPRFLVRMLDGFHHNGGPRIRGSVLTVDGGGIRLGAFAPSIAIGLQQCPDMMVCSSASTFFGAEMLRARNPRELAEGLKNVANTPFDRLFKNAEWKYKLPMATAHALEAWERRRTKGAMVNDFLFDDAHPCPPGLEGFRHRLQVTITVGIVHKKRVKDLEVGEFVPGEQKEVCFWDAVKANYKTFMGSTSMRQYVFPRDLFSHDPARPHALGPLGVLLRDVIGGDDDKAVMKWLNTQYQATWNVHSSRNPLGIKAMAVGLRGGHAMIISDGQTLGPPPLIAAKQHSWAIVNAVRTMPVDLRHRYDDRYINEIDLTGETAAALDFDAFTREVAYEMSKRGLVDACERRGELREKFAFEDETVPYDVASNRYPLMDRADETFWECVYYSLPAFMEAGLMKTRELAPSPREAIQRAFDFVTNVVREKGPGVIGKDTPDLSLEPATPIPTRSGLRSRS